MYERPHVLQVRVRTCFPPPQVLSQLLQLDHWFHSVKIFTYTYFTLFIIFIVLLYNTGHFNLMESYCGVFSFWVFKKNKLVYIMMAASGFLVCALYCGCPPSMFPEGTETDNMCEKVLTPKPGCKCEFE